MIPESPRIERNGSAFRRNVPSVSPPRLSRPSHELPRRSYDDRNDPSVLDASNRKLAQNQSDMSRQIADLRSAMERQGEMLRQLLEREVYTRRDS